MIGWTNATGFTGVNNLLMVRYISGDQLEIMTDNIIRESKGNHLNYTTCQYMFINKDKTPNFHMVYSSISSSYFT